MLNPDLTKSLLTTKCLASLDVNYICNFQEVLQCWHKHVPIDGNLIWLFTATWDTHVMGNWVMQDPGTF